MMELVSVILPTHNRAELLEGAINSVLSQAYSNIEIIIVADACTDNTSSLLSKYKNNHRFKIIESESNVGGAEARNIGIKNSSGTFLTFLDDDDLWFSDKIAKQVEVFRNRDDVCIVGCNYINIKDGAEISRSHIPEQITLEDMLYYNILGSFSFCMTRRKFAEGLEITKSIKAAQDWELWVKILLKTKSNASVCPDLLVYYNCSVSHSRLSMSNVDVMNSHALWTDIFWNHMSTSQRRFNKAVVLNRKSYTLEPNSLGMYLKSLIYILLTINRVRLRHLLGLIFRFWRCQLNKKRVT
jgi:teichuronic acid biosynthesis glycosyltransferase TuaG